MINPHHQFTSYHLNQTVRHSYFYKEIMRRIDIFPSILQTIDRIVIKSNLDVLKIFFQTIIKPTKLAPFLDM